MIAVTYRIITEQPLLATSLEGEPNSAISFDYIPGSLIRGAVAGQMAQGADDLAETYRALLFNGAVRYLNAYPAPEEEAARRLPVPASWQVKKLKAHEDPVAVSDFALLSAADREKLGQTVDLAGYTPGSDTDNRRYRPERQIAIHTLRDRTAGRATQVLGAVYRYDAVARGEIFRGAVIVQSQAQAAQVQTLLANGTYHLGGAQGGGYGKVTIDDVQVNPNWQEYPHTARDIAPGEHLRITLLSDSILRSEDGRTTANLAGVLPLPVEPVESYRKTTFVGGFNRKWGLPLPQEQALKAGSVFVLRAKEAIDAGRIQTLIEQGVGERRAEGFGRIAVDWGRQASFTSEQDKRSRETQRLGDLTLSDDALRLAQRMEDRLLRRALDKELVDAVSRLKPTGAISNSQLSRLRIIARSALASARAAPSDKSPLQRLVVLFDEQDERSLRSTALAKYNKVRVAGTRLPRWIADLAQKPEMIWEVLDQSRRKPLVPGSMADGDLRDPDLAVEYTVRLIDGVLAAAMEGNR